VRDEDRSRRTRHAHRRSRSRFRREHLVRQALRQDVARRRSLRPRRSSSRRPKADERARRLLEADLPYRPTANLSERREFLRTVAELRAVFIVGDVQPHSHSARINPRHPASSRHRAQDRSPHLRTPARAYLPCTRCPPPSRSSPLQARNQSKVGWQEKDLEEQRSVTFLPEFLSALPKSSLPFRG
jgi:hypothetical protein